MHGLLLLDKPAGTSSARAIEPVKLAAGRRIRVGHSGTLDPFATGLLLVLLGDATRLGEFAISLSKVYDAVVLFGTETDTLDPEGEVVDHADPGVAAPAGLEAALRGFVGEVRQVPPAHSALKVDGRRAYRLARAGMAVDLPPRTVRIDGIETSAVTWPRVSLRIRCGAGTYVRALARDLGRELGLPARLDALRRIAIGPFGVEAALAIEPRPGREEIAGRLLPLASITRAAGLREIALPEADAKRFAHGVGIPVETEIPAGERIAVHRGAKGTLLGLGAGRSAFLLSPVKVFSSSAEDLGP